MEVTREEVILGLRELAEFLEKNPSVPVDNYPPFYATISAGVGYEDGLEPKSAMSSLVLIPGKSAMSSLVLIPGKSAMSSLVLIPGKWRKGYDASNEYGDGCFRLYRDFSGGIKYHAYTQREKVCTKRVVGKRRVEAVPAIEAHDVDVVEWECEPLLKEEK